MSEVARLYQAFDPLKPLQADDPYYVDWQKACGPRDIKKRLT